MCKTTREDLGCSWIITTTSGVIHDYYLIEQNGVVTGHGKIDYQPGWSVSVNGTFINNILEWEERPFGSDPSSSDVWGSFSTTIDGSKMVDGYGIFRSGDLVCFTGIQVQ